MIPTLSPRPIKTPGGGMSAPVSWATPRGGNGASGGASVRTPYPMLGTRPVSDQPAAPEAWKPASPPSAKPVSVGAILGALQSGQSGYGGGAVVPVHNPQPNYWNYAANGGIGFMGGLGGAALGGGGGNAMNQGWAGDRVQEQNPYASQQQSAQMSPLGSLANAYQTAQDEARAANEQRYENILGGYQDRYDRAMSQLQGVGEQQRTDLNRRYNSNKGEIATSLVARGMSNSTVKDNLEAGNERERDNSLNRLEESLTRERLGYDTQLRDDQLKFMERRNDTYPDLNQLLQLAQMMGLATPQGASFGGMGGGGTSANGFPAPGNFGMGGGGGGGQGGGQPLNPFQQNVLQQNLAKAGAQLNPNSTLTPYQQILLAQNQQKQTLNNVQSAVKPYMPALNQLANQYGLGFLFNP